MYRTKWAENTMDIVGHKSVVDTQERQKEGVCSFMVSRMHGWLVACTLVPLATRPGPSPAPRGTQCQTGDWSLTCTVWDSVPSPFSVAGTQCPVPIRSRPPARDPVPSLGRLAGTRCPVPPVPAQIGLKTSQIKPKSGLKRVKSLFRQAI